MTPAGIHPFRGVFFREDRLAEPISALPCQVIGEVDGWCDDPADPAYNRLIQLPYPARHEQLMREDALYDLIIVLGYNDDPVVPGKGSAIFLHVAQADYAPTQGCVGLALKDLLTLLADIRPGDGIDIRLSGRPEAVP